VRVVIGLEKLTHARTWVQHASRCSRRKMVSMDLVAVIRHNVLTKGVPIRDVARQLGLSRNTIHRYVRPAQLVIGQRVRLGAGSVEPIAMTLSANAGRDVQHSGSFVQRSS
jgi:transposase-like protein